MFYIFNNKNECVASCSFLPDEEDLSSRLEFFIETEDKVSIGDKCIDGNIIVQDPAPLVIDYEVKARFYRNTLRNQLDYYLKPASTIADELVTEEQKTTLINDSLLLARWPAAVGWPYIQLPELSQLSKTLLNNPVWTYPTEELIDGN